MICRTTYRLRCKRRRLLSKSQRSLMLILTLSTMANLFAEKFWDQPYFWQTLVRRTKSWQWVFQSRWSMTVTLSSVNTTVMSFHSITRMEQRFPIRKLSLVAGLSRTQFLKNYKSRLLLKSDQKWAKSSLWLSRHQRTNSKQRLFLSLTSRWLRTNSKTRLVYRKSWITKPKAWSLRRKKFAERWMYSYWDTLITQRSSVWNSSSTRLPTRSLSLWPWRKLRESKDSNYLSRIWVTILSLISSLLSSRLRTPWKETKTQSRHSWTP